MRIGLIALSGVLVVGLAACGQSRLDRGLSGAGIGAATGAVGSAVTGGSAAEGAIIGGVAGGAIGALTDDRDFDLGRPVWR